MGRSSQFAAVCSGILLSAFIIAGSAWGFDDAGSLLDSVRRASGYEQMQAFSGGLLVEGNGVAYGLEGGFRLYLLKNGCFRIEVNNALRNIYGFDGRHGWLVDDTGMPGHLELAALETMQMIASVLGGTWLSPSSRMQYQLLSPQNGDSVHTLSLKLAEGVLTAQLVINSFDYLPRRLSWMSAGTESYLELGDYRETSGFMFPYWIAINEAGELTEINVEKVLEAPDESEALCRPVRERPKDITFLEDRSFEIEMQRSSTGHLLVHPLVNGQDIGWFLFDTGAGRSLLDSSAAVSLRAIRMGEFAGAGGGGIVKLQLVKCEKLELGSVVIAKPIFVSVNLSAISAGLGRPIGGIIGYDFLARCLVDLSIADTNLKVYPSDAFLSKDIQWQEIIFNRNSPSIRCSFDGGDGIFILDCGASGGVLLFPAFAAERGMLTTEDSTQGRALGVGGQITTRKGNFSWFKLGSERYENLNVGIASNQQGAFAEVGVAGLIGVDLLSRYHLIFDYPNKRMAFLPLRQ